MIPLDDIYGRVKAAIGKLTVAQCHFFCRCCLETLWKRYSDALIAWIDIEYRDRFVDVHDLLMSGQSISIEKNRETDQLLTDILGEDAGDRYTKPDDLMGDFASALQLIVCLDQFQDFVCFQDYKCCFGCFKCVFNDIDYILDQVGWPHSAADEYLIKFSDDIVHWLDHIRSLASVDELTVIEFKYGY